MLSSKKGRGKMKYTHVIMDHVGGPDVLHMQEDDVPEPKTGEVRIEILATDVSFSNVLMQHGQYPGAPKVPFTPGYDLVGRVDKIGPEVSGIEPGQLVAALTVYGSYSQYICLPSHELISMPAGMDPAEAVCLVLSYVSAYQMLHRMAHVKPGERILVHGAAGGVGTALLQLGTLAGVEVYGTASQSKHELVTSLGAIPIDYKTEDFVKRIFTLTGDGVDVVFDPIGGTHINQSFKTLRKGGRLVAYGFSSVREHGGNPLLNIAWQSIRMMLWSLSPSGKKGMFYSITGFKKKHPEWFRQDLSLLLDLLMQGKIKPVIARRLPLAEVVSAHKLLEDGGVEGKLVLLPHP
jgi:NADPH:quinone reductase-like Zn-dependent oxidoreductase